MKRNLTRTSFAVGFVNLALKPISMAKEIYIASSFGTSPAMDAFFIALGIPNLFATLLGSPVASSFTPVFMREKNAGRGHDFHRRVLALAILTASISALLIVIFRRPLASMAAPGLSSDGQLDVARVLLLLSPYLLLLVVAEFQTNVLAALRRFIQASAWQVLMPLATIAALWFLGPTLRNLSLGLALGAFLVAISVTLSLTRSGWGGIATPKPTAAVREMSREVPILMLSGALLQLNLFIDRLMASTLPDGSVAALNYAYRLLMFAQVIFVVPFGQLLLTYFSEHCAKGEWTQMVNMTNRAFRSALLALLPVCIFGMVFAHESARLVYERGEFTAESTKATAAAFAAYLPTFLIIGSTLALPRFFNATQRNRFMLLQTTISLVLNVVLNFVLMRQWGHIGIAVSTSLTILVGRLILYFRMRRLVHSHGSLQGFHHLGTIALGTVMYFLMTEFARRLDPSLPLIARLLLGGVTTLATYLVLVRLVRWKDFREFYDAIRAR